MNRYSISEAAKALGVTQQAIHGRIGRGTIPTERGEDGKQYVFLSEEEIQEQRVNNPLANGYINDYITSLKSEIETLRSHTETLINDREEWKEEARRKDTIIAQMNQSLSAMIHKIPELEAPQETTPEPAESRVSPSEEEDKGSVPHEPENRSWWRRIFAPPTKN